MMRFHQSLLLQKQEAEELNRREMTAEILSPLKEKIHTEYLICQVSTLIISKFSFINIPIYFL